MWTDSIVEEVRAVKDKIAKKYHYDLNKLTKAIKNHEAKSRKEKRIFITKETLNMGENEIVRLEKIA